VKVVEHVPYVHACRRCEEEDIRKPDRYGLAACACDARQPGIAVYVGLYHEPEIYTDSLLLYRQEQPFLRLGVELSCPDDGELADRGQRGVAHPAGWLYAYGAESIARVS
jgi:hypothetical protein